MNSPLLNCFMVSYLTKILPVLNGLCCLCKSHCGAAGAMNCRVLLLGQKLEMLWIHTVLIEAQVMYLPPQGTVRTGRERNRSIRFRPGNSVGIFCPTITRERDCRVAALAGTASSPVPARGYEVDCVFAVHAGGSACRETFE